MKPRTKLQFRVFNLAQNLPVIDGVQKTWALHHCLKHEAYRTKKNTSCLDCGHQWTGQAGKTCDCPSCGTKLTITDTRKKITTQRAFMSILDVREDFQIIRHHELKTYHKAGTPAERSVREVAQIWLLENGTVTIYARNRGGMGYYNDGFNGALEIKPTKAVGWYGTGWENKYNIYPDRLYPETRCLPIFKRNGFKGKLAGCSPYSLFSRLLTDSKTETLLKAHQYGLLAVRTASDKASVINHYWATIKIAIRHKYIVKDGITYLDYLDLLNYFQKDLHNPVYVCPADLMKEHNDLVAKRTVVEERLKLERIAADAEAKRRKLEADKLAFIKAKSAFFGLVFSDEKITIKVLESVEEFEREAKILKHCVYTNAYYNKANSLILSARIRNKPIETIEIQLSTMTILQSRGLGNEATKYNEQIVELVKKNLRVIRKTYKESKQAKTHNKVSNAA